MKKVRALLIIFIFLFLVADIRTVFAESIDSKINKVTESDLEVTNKDAVLIISGDSNVKVGKTIKLKAYLTSGTASNLKWKSSNKKIAVVTKNGKVRGVKIGTVTIKVSANGKTATKIVNVTKNDNIINGKKYKVSKENLIKITALCIAEQGSSLNGVKWEASLIANLTDKKTWGTNPYTVSQSAWFASDSKKLSQNAGMNKKVSDRGKVTKKFYNAVHDIIVNGNRVTRADEHDEFTDIKYIQNGTKKITSKTGIKNRKNYIPNKTIIYNNGGATYRFIAFPCKKCDPFGKAF